MKTNAHHYTVVGFSATISKITNLSLALFLFAFLPASAFGQHDDWKIRLTGGQEIENASLQGLEGDWLRISSDLYSGRVHVDSVARMQRGGGHYVPSVVVGAAIGGAVGYYIGNNSDNRTTSSYYGGSSSSTSGAATGTLAGACVGGLLGGISGAFGGKEVHKLSLKSPTERRAEIRTILTRDGAAVLPESPALAAAREGDIVYLKNGSVVQGMVMEIIPDSTVRILTADSSVFVFRVSEVGRVTGEPEATRTGASQPMRPQVQLDAQLQNPNRRMSFTFHGGVGIPVGALGKTSGATAGLAKTGFIVGANMNYMLGDIGSWVTSLDFSFHGIDEAVLGVPNGVSSDIGSWLLVWPMTGIRITAMGSSEVRPYVQLQIGLLAGSSPAMSFSSGTEQVNQSSASATSLAFSAGVGIHASNLVSIGARYFYGEPEYEISLTSSSLSGRYKYKQPTSVFVLVLGITP